MSSEITQLHDPDPFRPPKDGRCMFDQLPTELLIRVFLLGPACVPEIGDDRHPSVLTEDRALAFEILVTHVCRRWREVAVDMTALWTSVHFKSPPYERPAAYLERSQKAPIVVTIDLTNVQSDVDVGPLSSRFSHMFKYMDGGIGNTANLAHIWALVAPHTSHLRTLKCTLSKSVLMRAFVRCLAASPPAPMLEELDLADTQQQMSLSDTTYAHRITQDTTVPFGGVAPNLKYVRLGGVSLPWPRAPFPSGLTTLVLQHHFSGRRPAFQDLARILHESPQLKSLTLCRSGPAGPPSEWAVNTPGGLDGSGITSSLTPYAVTLPLPSLTELVLTFDDAEYAAGLLKWLVVPNLTSLSLSIHDTESACVMEALLYDGPPGRRKPLLAGLESLCIHSLPGWHQVTTERALELMSNLTTLQLDLGNASYAWYTSLLLGLRRGGEPGQLTYCTCLPKLTTLTIGGTQGNMVCNLVGARQQQGVPLSYVTMVSNEPLDESDQRWIESNVQKFTLVERPPDEHFGEPNGDPEIIWVNVPDVDDLDDEDSDDEDSGESIGGTEEDDTQESDSGDDEEEGSS